MRLIDADALKEATKHYTDSDGFNPVWQIIDNATTECEAYRSFCTAKQRPQGEWIRTQLRGRTYFVCDKCHARYDLMYDYCPHCGAEMSSKAVSEQSTKTSDDAKKIADAAYERIMRGDLTGGFPANARRRNA